MEAKLLKMKVFQIEFTFFFYSFRRKHEHNLRTSWPCRLSGIRFARNVLIAQVRKMEAPAPSELQFICGFFPCKRFHSSHLLGFLNWFINGSFKLLIHLVRFPRNFNQSFSFLLFQWWEDSEAIHTENSLYHGRLAKMWISNCSSIWFDFRVISIIFGGHYHFSWDRLLLHVRCNF